MNDQIITFKSDDENLLEGTVNNWLQVNDELNINDIWFDTYKDDNDPYTTFVCFIWYEEKGDE